MRRYFFRCVQYCRVAATTADSITYNPRGCWQLFSSGPWYIGSSKMLCELGCSTMSTTDSYSVWHSQGRDPRRKVARQCRIERRRRWKRRRERHGPTALRYSSYVVSTRVYSTIRLRPSFFLRNAAQRLHGTSPGMQKGAIEGTVRHVRLQPVVSVKVSSRKIFGIRS